MLRLAPSRIHGTGVVATEPVAAGTRLGVAHHRAHHRAPWRSTVLGLYHNHSVAPTAVNVRDGDRRWLVAARPLEPGDEVTVDYRLQPDLEQPRACWALGARESALARERGAYFAAGLVLASSGLFAYHLAPVFRAGKWREPLEPPPLAEAQRRTSEIWVTTCVVYGLLGLTVHYTAKFVRDFLRTGEVPEELFG